ncbi:MAG: hypothetical protein JRN09_05335 [Nitrososphaerota archaeon]|jgi:hypothetical protein|nr:hypothetical protein [Nitrososphaerota archaeon]
MNATLELSVECGSSEQAWSLQSVLAPDNRSAPKDQAISSEVVGKTLRLVIRSPRAASCISSGLSILNDVRLFQEIWSLTA